VLAPVVVGTLVGVAWVTFATTVLEHRLSSAVAGALVGLVATVLLGVSEQRRRGGRRADRQVRQREAGDPDAGRR
jgi:hypothetical protein